MEILQEKKSNKRKPGGGEGQAGVGQGLEATHGCTQEPGSWES